MCQIEDGQDDSVSFLLTIFVFVPNMVLNLGLTWPFCIALGLLFFFVFYS